MNYAKFHRVPILCTCLLFMGNICFANPVPENQAIPRLEHPRPQFQGEDWIILNGKWNFAFDFGLEVCQSGYDRLSTEREKQILEPFLSEGELSGMGYITSTRGAWFSRILLTPES